MNLIEELGLEKCQEIVDRAPESVFPVKWGLGFKTYFRQVGYFVEQWHDGKWKTLYSDPTWVDLETLRAAIADHNQRNKSLDFKVEDWVGIKDDSISWIKKIERIEHKKVYDSLWNTQNIEVLIFEDGTRLGSAWAIHATPEEIAAGHRIDHSVESTEKVEQFGNSEELEVLEMIDVSPNCGVVEHDQK